MKLGVTLDILNQKDTPAFYADTLANRPAAGFTGRVFISTDTLDLYRDTGTTWVLLSPSSTGTITGSGAAGQVTYFSAASSITGSNDLFFDSVNGHLGIGTITPSTALTIFHDQNQIIQINQTTATNDTKIAFQNSGTPLWRIGNSYNAGANDWGIFDVVGSIQPLTIKKTTGQTFIGSQTTSSGLLVVNSSTADNQIVAIGANSPSIRVRNAGTAPTQQFGLGLATATNNFIQGSASGDFCLFNGSTTASPMLLGIYDAGAGNVQEAARISAARNFLIGTSVDDGYKLSVNGNGSFSGSVIATGIYGFYVRGRASDNFGAIGFYSNSLATRYGYIQSGSTNGGQLNINADGGAQIIMDSVGSKFSIGNVAVGNITPNLKLDVLTGTSHSAIAQFSGSVQGRGLKISTFSTGTTDAGVLLDAQTTSQPVLAFGTNATECMRVSATQNLLIGTTTDAGQKLQVAGMLNSGISYRSSTYTAGDTTPSVVGISFLDISNSSSTSITNFTGAIEGQVLTLYFNDSNTTVTRTNAYLSGGVNFVSTAYDILTLIYKAPYWYELSRSINS